MSLARKKVTAARLPYRYEEPTVADCPPAKGRSGKARGAARRPPPRLLQAEPGGCAHAAERRPSCAAKGAAGTKHRPRGAWWEHSEGLSEG